MSKRTKEIKRPEAVQALYDQINNDPNKDAIWKELNQSAAELEKWVQKVAQADGLDEDQVRTLFTALTNAEY